MPETIGDLIVPLKERSESGKLRYLAALLDDRGTEEIIRFAVASCLLAMAARIDGKVGG